VVVLDAGAECSKFSATIRMGRIPGSLLPIAIFARTISFIRTAKNRIASASLKSWALPYKVATLLYCFNEGGDGTLLPRNGRRRTQTAAFVWSPAGRKAATWTSANLPNALRPALPAKRTRNWACENSQASDLPPYGHGDVNMAIRGRPTGSCFFFLK